MLLISGGIARSLIADSRLEIGVTMSADGLLRRQEILKRNICPWRPVRVWVRLRGSYDQVRVVVEVVEIGCAGGS